MSAPIPLKIRLPKNFAGSAIIAIRIQDVARDVWYSCTGNNAPVGQTPMITPGAGNLYIAFYAVNNYTYSVNMSLYIYDANYNVIAQQVNIYTHAGANAGIEYTGTMPTGTYTIILYSVP